MEQSENAFALRLRRLNAEKNRLEYLPDELGQCLLLVSVGQL
jgi:hypothetical protein